MLYIYIGYILYMAYIYYLGWCLYLGVTSSVSVVISYNIYYICVIYHIWFRCVVIGLVIIYINYTSYIGIYLGWCLYLVSVVTPR